MKILYITPRFPFPPRKGDQVVAFHRLRTLGNRHEITLLTFYEHDRELRHLPNLEPFCKAIHTFKHPRWLAWTSLVLGFFMSDLPLQVQYFKSRGLVKKLRYLVDKEKPEIVHAFMLRMAPYLEGLGGAACST